MEILQILAGFAVLVGGAELLVRGSSAVALRLGVSPLIVSLTLVSIGTSAPEIAVTVQASVTGRTAMALGNVIGSNVANVGLVIGICALLHPLTARPRLIRFDVPVVILFTALVGVLAVAGRGLSTPDGAVLILGFLGYLGLTVRRGIVESRRLPKSPLSGAPAAESRGGARDSPSGSLGLLPGIVFVAMFAGGITALVFGSRMLVAGASAIALRYGMPEVLVGSTIVAVGTSLPEVATSAVATIRGHTGIAIGNAVGSCAANFGLVLGAGCLSAGFLDVPDGLVRTDVLAAFSISIVLLVFLVTRRRVSRVEGAMLLGGYGVYLFLATNGTSPAALERLPLLLGAYASLLLLVVLFDLRTLVPPGRGRRTY